MVDGYSDNTDDNYQSEPDITKISIKKILTLFIPGKSGDFAIFRVFFVCFPFDIEKWDF